MPNDPCDCNYSVNFIAIATNRLSAYRQAAGDFTDRAFRAPSQGQSGRFTEPVRQLTTGARPGQAGRAQAGALPTLRPRRPAGGAIARGRLAA